MACYNKRFWPGPGHHWRPARTRCINARTPETGANRLEGSFDSFDAKAERVPSYRPRRIQNPLLWGGGFYVHYSNQPWAQCKGRSDPFTEISPDAPTTRRFGPLYA